MQPVEIPIETRERANLSTSRVFQIADEYVDAAAALDPFVATSQGVGDHGAEVTDYSPTGESLRASNDRAFRVALHAAPVTSEFDRIARDVLLSQIDKNLESFDAGDALDNINNIASPVQYFRDIFDLDDPVSEEDWHKRARRLSGIADSIAGYKETLRQGIATNRFAARRQALAAAEQCVTRGAEFASSVLVNAYEAKLPAALLRDLEQSAAEAGAAYVALGAWLTETYAPRARVRDAVGPERYSREAAKYCGIDVDLRDTYEWGIEQVLEIRAHMERVANDVLPGSSIDEVMAFLDSDPSKAIQGEDQLVEFLQSHMDWMLSELDGKHFTIAEPGRIIQQMIAPPGGAAAQYYTAPSEDWTRPGRCWFPTQGRTSFPLWGEISTANHEGVPGHHLQAVASLAAKDTLSRFQQMHFLSGHGEGWALYAERLSFELGLLEKPEYILGWLSACMLRAVRVVVDIGMHCGDALGLRTPKHAPIASGQQWNATTAYDYAVGYIGQNFDMRSEVDRYLGWPGQAISYKVGEREWLAARDDAKSALGASFSLKEFHEVALSLGAMGLAQLRIEIARALTKRSGEAGVDGSPESLESPGSPESLE